MNLLVIHIVAFYSQERLLEKLREEEALSQAVFLKGDVICSAQTARPRSLLASEQFLHPPSNTHSSQVSVCSCTCLETWAEWRQIRRKRTTQLQRTESNLSLKLIFAMRRSSV